MLNRFLVIFTIFISLIASGQSSAQSFVVLDDTNNFTDVLEPGVTINRSVGFPGSSGTGPLRGTNLEFSCGTCDVAHFSDAVSQIGGGPPGQICGYSASAPRFIVLNDDQICARSTFSPIRWDIDLLTFSSANCFENPVGGCAIAGGFTSYLRAAFATPSDLLDSLISDVMNLNLKSGIANSLDAKINTALQALDDMNQNNDVAAINALQAFINAVRAQRGNNISETDADALIADAQAIIDLLNT